MAIARFAILLLLALGVGATRGAPQPLTVFAAASLKTALDPVNRDFTAASGVPVRASYAASSALAKQIAQGAAEPSRRYLEFLQSPRARAVFEQQGFAVLARD